MMTPTDWDGWICLGLKVSAVALLVGMDLCLLVSLLGWIADRIEEKKK